MPELRPWWSRRRNGPTAPPTQGQVEIPAARTRRILLVRISAASNAGAVVTFDDPP